jgi:O-antigen/teichoic acid export membrane protein
MSSVHRAIAFSAADKYASQLLQLVTLAIMSRLLTPGEIGLYMIASSIFVLADSFRTFGVGVYVVQEQDLRRETLRTAFTITLVLSLATAGVLTLLASPLAAFYADPELAHLVVLSTLALLFVPFASPVVALLQREMAFRALAIVNLGAGMTGSLVTISLGLAGVGAASYVWGTVAQSLAIAVIAIAIHRDGAIFRLSLTDARRMMAFGATSSSVALVNMAYDLLPRLAFGKILGLDALGIYARAVTVCQLPDRAIGAALQPVVLPAMAAHARAGGDLKASYLRGLTLITSVQWPTLVVLALLADPVVRVLLGAQWDAAAPLVRIVALGMTALAPALMTFPLLVATGRIRDALLSTAIAVPPSIAIAIGAATFGLTAVAASALVTAPFQMLVAFHFVRRAVGLEWREAFAAMRSSLAMTAGTAAVPALVVVASPHGFDLGWV